MPPDGMTPRDKLESIAINLWWSWDPEARSLFRRLNPEVFRAANNNPQAALATAKEAVLEDPAVQDEIDSVYARYRDYMERDPQVEDAPETAYFCMEYGLHESLTTRRPRPTSAFPSRPLASSCAKDTSDSPLTPTAGRSPRTRCSTRPSTPSRSSRKGAAIR